MGVHGLWEILGPTARPVRLEALSRRKLAVDASIWIYQFLKAVRDKEGNALRNSHIVGFFRRICKLLYFGIYPVFVFDGGAPALKRKTVTKRRERREGKKESIRQTAQRILAAQLQKQADARLNNKSNSPVKATKSPKKAKNIPEDQLQFAEYYEDNNYLDGENNVEKDNNPQESNKEVVVKESQSEKIFRREDDFDLPYLEGFKKNTDDNRVMEDEEYYQITEDLQDDLSGVDLDTIDPKSEEFDELPLETQYIVLSHLRLRSRLRMGYTKDQLETIFPNSMDFSKFQIQMVQKRNYLTQRLMKATGMDNTDATERRIAGQRDRHYTLQKNDKGYTLSIENEGSSAKKAIHLDDERTGKLNVKTEIKNEDLFGEEDSDDDDIDWQDVDGNGDVKKSKRTIAIKEPSFQSKSFLDPSIHANDNEALFISESEDEDGAVVDENPEEDEDYKMAMVKSLYEYAQKNNKKKRTSSEEELKNYDSAQLREAIELSKREYNDLRIQESSGTGLPDQHQNVKVPLIFSKLTLKGSLFDRAKAPVRTESKQSTNKPQHSNKAAKVVEIGKDDIIDFDLDDLEDGAGKDVGHQEENDNENEPPKPKALPLPQWFSSDSNNFLGNKFQENIGYSSNSKPYESTEDEKAGLISYREIHNYIDDDGDRSEDGLYDNPKKSSPIEIIDDDEDDDGDDEFEEFEDVPLIDKTSVEQVDHKSVLHPIDEIVELEDKVPEVSEGVGLDSSDKPPNEGKHIAEILNGNDTGAKTVAKESEAPANYADYEFSESEEEHLAEQLENEELAYGKFVDGLNTQRGERSSFWDLDKEKELQQRNKDKRDADEVTSGMIADVQDLLSRFGIPFITAPMEAEAQCAELYKLGLVDGIITDDSDCFLFGGERIYKNMFSEKNFVECYFAGEIERDLGLTRDKLIELALLLGSDYTEGLKGVGVVNAMEILAEFAGHNEADSDVLASGTLVNFREWWLNYQNGGELDEKESTLKKKLRKKLKSTDLFLNNLFPDPLVYEAYIKPEVDSDETQFKWGAPDLDRLRTYLMFTVGWNQQKVDQVLIPVIKDMNRRKQEGLQSTLGEFFPSEMIQKRRAIMTGKRLKDATSKLISKTGSNDSNKKQRTS